MFRIPSLLISVLAISCLFPVSTTGQTLDFEDLQQTELAVQPSNAILWQIDRGDLVRPSYIMGIIRLMPHDHFFLPPTLSQYLNTTDKLVMEIDPLEGDVAHLHRGNLPIDSTLDIILPKKQLETISTFFTDSLSPSAYEALLDRYSPNQVTRIMMTDYCLGWESGREPVNVELYLRNAIEKPFKGLNTFWARTNWNDSHSIQRQVDNFVGQFNHRKTSCQYYDAMLNAYRKQDLDLVALLSKSAPDLGDNMGRKVVERNDEWLSSLIWHLQYESLFIAVQAPQLPGEDGLLHRLRKAGFTVTPIFE
ncbi:TraB/GumN family protein [Pontibacter sp. G13]|uniref:TraB/GumN family protein n=1 Tax=Pontibacter sp. G13 TaxID=3074898 RepID=UPI002889F4C1|nr:TraB/GumN family protein [Pontibacter sp. G13]WNJ18567.1 TraB/GumN family protein [Pontibacter sp. G13]